MGRIVGKIEKESAAEPRYFIHCDTAGFSFPALIPDLDAARAARSIHDAEGHKAVEALYPARSKSVQVVRMVWPYQEPRFALATDDRLLWPRSSDDWGYSFLEHDGVLHIAKNVYGGFDGDYDEPICVTTPRLPLPGEKSLGLSELFGKELTNLCPHCASKLTGL